MRTYGGAQARILKQATTVPGLSGLKESGELMKRHQNEIHLCTLAVHAEGAFLREPVACAPRQHGNVCTGVCDGVVTCPDPISHRMGAVAAVVVVVAVVFREMNAKFGNMFKINMAFLPGFGVADPELYGRRNSVFGLRWRADVLGGGRLRVMWSTPGLPKVCAGCCDVSGGGLRRLYGFTESPHSCCSSMVRRSHARRVNRMSAWRSSWVTTY